MELASILRELEMRGTAEEWRALFSYRWPRTTWNICYWRYIHSAAWIRKRDACLENANHVCGQCGSSSAKQAHHLTYRNLGDERPEDLQPVCVACHERTHDRPPSETLNIPKRFRHE